MKRWLAALVVVAAGCSFPDYGVSEPQPLETCRDGLLSANEVSVDCGPACSGGCKAGDPCSSDGECQSGFCNQGACDTPSCSDGAANRTETDVDCGGSDGCQPCGPGQRCLSFYDCDGGACISGRCQAPSCGDGMQNQGESDVDCGGATTCDRCATKQHCTSDSDCQKAHCSEGRCQPESCDDGVQNGDETDRDCGGSCQACASGEVCGANSDCQSQLCDTLTLRCLPPSCDDQVLNGTESSVDCGRDCPSQCGMTLSCNGNADCESGACSGQRCVPKMQTDQPLSTSGWQLSASATFNQDTVPGKAIDGDLGSHWTSGTGQLPGMWFQIDMRTPQAFYSIELSCTSNGDYPRSIRVLLSEDGTTFTPASGTVAGEPTLRLDFPEPQIARYIKLELEQDTNGLWWRIDELRVLN